MASHDAVRDLLASYADKALAAPQREAVEVHLSACRECTTDIVAFRRLNTVLAGLPPAPPLPFHPFWARLQASLPKAAGRRQPWFTPGRRMALAFVAATLAALMVGVSAFASESVLPDNPLFAVKRVREAVQITVTVDPQARARLEVQLAAERLREAQAMAGRGKPELAVLSLKRFDDLLKAAEPALRHPANEKQRKAVEKAIDALRNQLETIQDINEAQGDDLDVKASVETARALLSRDDPVEQPEIEVKLENEVKQAPVTTETPKPREREQPESRDSKSGHGTDSLPPRAG